MQIPQSSMIAVPPQIPLQSILKVPFGFPSQSIQVELSPPQIPQSSIKLVFKSGLGQYGSGSILLSVQPSPGSLQKPWLLP